MSSTVELDVKQWNLFLKSVTRNFKRLRDLLKVAAESFAFQDIIDHFANEEGPDGPWQPRSEVTQFRYAMINSGQWRPPKGASRAQYNPTNKILQMTGALRQSLIPTKGKMTNHGPSAIRLFTNVKYSRKHDEGGGGTPQREFMWLSDETQEKLASTVLQLILEDTGGK